jgi:membrane protease subunit HflK
MDQLTMTWNEPGNEDESEDDDSYRYNKDDFRKRMYNDRNKRPQDGPPDLDEVFNELRKQFAALFGFKKGSAGNSGKSGNTGGPGKFNTLTSGNNNNFFLMLFGLILVIYLISGFYIVRPAEQAVVTRFGKFQRMVGPGPHWIFKFIEKKKIVNIEQISSSRHSASMLTKDENIIFVEIELQYRVADAKDYLFNVSEPVKTLKQATESALRQVVGHEDLDFIMTEGRAQISLDVEKQVTEILQDYNLGIQVVTVAFKEAKAPEAVKSAFDDVIKAREEQERLRHAAEAYANKVVPEAKGEAKQMLVEAEAYQQEVIAKAKGDTLRFDAVLKEYNKAQDITKKRMYIDTLEEVLSKTSKILVDLKNSNNLVYLPLDQLVNKKPQGTVEGKK